MLRFILAVVVIAIYLIVTSPLHLYVKFHGVKNQDKFDLKILHCAQWILGITGRVAGARVIVKGLENVPEDEAVLFVGNHRSYADIIVTYPLMKGLTGYVAKKEMERWPLVKFWMNYLHCLFIDRSDLKQELKTILAAIKEVENGISIFIFPEGTRCKSTDNLEMLPFKEGSFKIASKSGCRIVPVAITGSSEFFGQHKLKVTLGDVTVEFGRPFRISDLEDEDKKFPGAYTQAVILDMLKKEKEIREGR